MKRMLDQKLIDFLNSLGDSLKYESSSNTFEIGTNLYVDGIADFGNEVNLGVLNIKQFLYDDDFNCVKISYSKDDDCLAFDFTGGGVTYYLEPNGSDGNIVTSDNVKTLFGNQLLIGSGNIDLYVHYLKFSIGKEISFYGVVYSSNNNVTNTLQKLTTLLKPPSSAQMFIPLTNDNNDNGVLYWNGSIWQVGYSGGGLNITSISDRVETI